MNHRALVSVVIPSFNHKDYIAHAIESVFNQTYPNMECVVIDDGSSDGSHDHIREKFGHDPRLKLTRRGNRGAHQTINEGIVASKGDFVAILNSDDTYEAERVEKMIAGANAAAAPFFGISGLNVMDENGNILDKSSGYNEYYDMICRFTADQPDIMGFWCGNIAITTSNFFFSREVFNETGPFKALRYAHDWDWALRASSKFNVHRLKGNLLNYRIHGKNTILETDSWAHVVENVYVVASALRREKIQSRNFIDGADNRSFFENLFKNYAFHPLPVLYLLADPRTEAEQLDLIASGALKEELASLFDGGRLHTTLSQCLRTLNDTVCDLHATAMAHGAMEQQVQARCEEEKRIALEELATIKGSMSWKLFSWIWRLETRKARRARRKAQA